MGSALLGVGADVDSAVKAWLKVLPSGQISDEETGRVDTTSGRWDTSGERHRPKGLFFCWPKHLQWKGEAPKNGYKPHNHHVWPQWIGGKQSETLPMSAYFHNSLFHTGAFETKLAERIAARDKKYRDLRRTADSAQGLYERLEEQGTAREFLKVSFEELRLLYQEFAEAHVTIGRPEFLVQVEQILAQVQSTGPSW